MAHADPTHLLATVYTAAAHDYARLWSPVVQPMGERLVAAMPLAKTMTILDIGTGSGALLPTIRAAAPAALVVGIDRADGMLHLAQSESPATPLAIMDAAQLGLRASAFDAALLAFVLFHLPDPVRGLSEVARVLRPGGVIGATTWGANQLLPGSAIWVEELDAHGAETSALPDAVQQHALMDTPDKVRELMEAAGLLPVRMWTEHLQRRWTWQELFSVRSGYGLYKRRLDTLPEDLRRKCLERIRDRLAHLSSAELVYRPDIIFTLARRS